MSYTTCIFRSREQSEFFEATYIRVNGKRRAVETVGLGSISVRAMEAELLYVVNTCAISVRIKFVRIKEKLFTFWVQIAFSCVFFATRSI